ncbi:NBR1-Ig-like domain-containing protein [Massilia endophytica]|uniref:NBR1-Ig-like domain-containing protein n=1 Tax=Massilia endophytica TaxID=2899220 RepID=UPI001E646ABF|nr:NBR1-Ig-like domain-containing protein [Massilia endophytica]UGQ48740.1 FG-GAP-like repeat-containing protein [Massilia endophytica]
MCKLITTFLTQFMRTARRAFSGGGGLARAIAALLLILGQANALAANGATYVTHNIPTTMVAGERYTISVTMMNTGTTTWSGTSYSLKLLNTTGWAFTGIGLGASAYVNTSKTFTLSMVAPTTPGTYGMQFQMYQTNIGWFGDYTPSVSIDVVPRVPDAQFVSQTAIPTMTGARTYTVKMRNTGNYAWAAGTSIQLGTQNPPDNDLWKTKRLNLSVATAVGAEGTFSGTIYPPVEGGYYDMQWQLVQSATGMYFGEATPVQTVAVAGPAPSVQVVSPAPTDIFVGNGGYIDVPVTVNATPTGIATITKVLIYYYDGTSYVLVDQQEGPTFDKVLRRGAGNQTLYARAVDSFNKWSPMTPFAIKAIVDNAVLSSHTIPTTMVPGAQYDVSITMKNTGGTTWDPANVELVAQNPLENTKFGISSMPLTEVVSPQGITTFRGTMTAPETTGVQGTQWRLRENTRTYFGSTVSVSVNVANPSNLSTVISRDAPTTMNAGQTYPVTIVMKNTGTATWTPEAGYYLTTPDTITAWGDIRVPVSGPIAPNATATFTFNVIAPAVGGQQVLAFRMKQDGMGIFGNQSSEIVNVLVGPPIVVIDGPPNGSTYAADPATDMAMVPMQGHATALGGNSILALFVFVNSDAPAFVHGPVFDGMVPMPVGANTVVMYAVDSADGRTTSDPITVYVTGKDAQFVSQTPAAPYFSGERRTISVTMRNNGTTTWQPGDVQAGSGMALVSDSPQDNQSWGIARVPLASAVAPGAETTFTFEVTAPATAGQHTMQWRMLDMANNVFGMPSDLLTLTVNERPMPVLSLSATPQNVRVAPGQSATVTITAPATLTGGQLTKLELFQDTGSGYGATPIRTANGPAASLSLNGPLSLSNGSYRFKLRATDEWARTVESAPVTVNVTDSPLQGLVSGVRSNASQQLQLVGWACRLGAAEALGYELYANAPPALGGTLAGSGSANASTELGDASVRAQCQTPDASHHFVIDLTAAASQFPGAPLYVVARAADGEQIVLPCEDNSCHLPQGLRIGLTSPNANNQDRYRYPAPAFMRAVVSGISGTPDEVTFNVNGSWVPGVDEGGGAYSASKDGLAAGMAPYTVFARVRFGDTILISEERQFYMDAGMVAGSMVPAQGSVLTLGVPTILSTTLSGPVPAGQSIRFVIDAQVAQQLRTMAKSSSTKTAAKTTTTMTATATTSGGSTVIEAQNNGDKWTAVWVPTQQGNFSMQARLYDGAGAELAASGSVAFTVGAGQGSGTLTPIVVDVPQLANDEAGSLPGKLAATPNGSAAYSIPFQLPPGTAGMVPNLGLSYDSAISSGPAGLGWSLAGLSEIGRCGRTVATDNASDGVRFSAFVGVNGTDAQYSNQPVDRLCLDGQRLVLVNGDSNSHAAYWAADAEYRTEIETFTRVRTVMVGAQRTFKVETRDGRTAYYGDTIDSYIEAIGRSDGQAHRWRVSRVADRSGNYVSYYYSEHAVNGESNPLEIRWGANSNSGQPHYAAARFSYEARPDARYAYVAGSPNFEADRLTQVTTFVGIGADGTGGTEAVRYTLNYEVSLSSQRSLLKSLVACDGATCLPATTFEYGTRSGTTPGFVSLGGPRVGPNLVALGNNGTGSGYAKGPLNEILVEDFNGDGKADILERYRVDANLHQQRLYESNPDGMGWTVKQPFSTIPGSLAVMESGDFDGDGKVDLLVADWNLGSPAYNWRMCWGRDFSNGSFACNGSISLPADSWSTTLQPPAPMRMVRDFNADGRDDLFLRSGDGVYAVARNYKCLSNGSGFDCQDVTGTYLAVSFGDAANGRPSSGTAFDDMDGDGRVDQVDLGRCMRVRDDGTGRYAWSCDGLPGGDGQSYVAVSTSTEKGAAQFYATWDPSPDNRTAALPPPSTGTLTGDFNGDGYSDLLYATATLDVGENPVSVRGKICLSKGNHEADCRVLPASNNPAFDHLVMMVADYDGDGLLDVLRPANDSWNQDNVTAYQLCHVGPSGLFHSCEPWAGPTFYGVRGDSVMAGVTYDDTYQRNRSMFLGDFDGDGKIDIATYTQGSTWEIFGSADLAKPGEALDRLVRVTNGFGLVEKAEYSPANSSVAYTHEVTAYDGPVVQQGKRMRPGQLVRAIHRSSGQGGWLDTEYAYHGFAMDPRRRSSIGFAQIDERDVQNDITSTSWFYQNHPYVGMVKHARTTDRDGTWLSDRDSTAVTRNIAQANGITTAFPYASPEYVAATDLDNSFLERSSVVSTYDDWGNQLTVTRQRYGTDNLSAGTITVTRTYDNDPLTWRLGEVRTNTETRSIGMSQQSRLTAYTYDGAGLLATETVEPNEPALRVQKTYDRSGNSFGLVNRTILGWTDPSGVSRTRTISDVTYTPDGRFPATRRNALNQEEALQFDARTGAMTRMEDANGLVSTATVNAFGRVLSSTAVDQTETWTYLKRCNADCPPQARFMQIKDFKLGLERIAVPKITFMDAAEHPVRSLTWGFDGRKVAADTEYDAQGRRYRSWQPAFVTDSEALAAEVPAGAMLASEFGYDDLDRVTSVQTRDEGGQPVTSQTSYSGLTVTWTNAKSQQKKETRDVWGRLKTSLDAYNKATTFNYDAFDNLLNTTDPLGNVVTMEYDKLGRKTDLRDPDLGWIHYDVDALGQVWRRIAPNQRAKGPAATFSTRTTYDELGRMTSRIAEDHSAGWVYDKLDSQADCKSNHSCGKLVESFTLAGSTKDFRKQHSYDLYGRPDTVVSYLDTAYISQVQYDNWGRTLRQLHQRGSGTPKVFDYRYNGAGQLERIERGALVLWQATGIDAADRVIDGALGNGTTFVRSYNPQTGRLFSNTLNKQGTRLVQDAYGYDSLGNVLTRGQEWQGNMFFEAFEYDSLNRVKNAQMLSESQPRVYTYDDIGNLRSKSGVGTYGYPEPGANSVRPHAVSSIDAGSLTYDANGNLLTAPGRSTPWTWTSFDMPKRTTKGSAYSDFVYGADRQRLRQTRSDGTDIYYAGALEAEVKGGAVTVKTYWPEGLGVEIERNGATSLNWLYKDRLGSVAAITDEAGNLKESMAYDVWGARRNLTTSETPAGLDGVVDNKGFTGHEMLDQVDLVHMNGRIYDPLVARFMSADPYIQDPRSGESFNRYSYVWNNPASFVDPTGFMTTVFVPGSRGPTLDELERFWSWANGVANNELFRKPAEAVKSVAQKAVKAGARVARWGGVAATLMLTPSNALQTPAGNCHPSELICAFDPLLGEWTKAAGEKKLAADYERNRQVLASEADSKNGTNQSDPAAPPQPGEIPTLDWNDPTKPPIGPNGEEWVWRGKPPQGGDKGGYVNPSNPDQSVHPDLTHPAPVGPHWDYTDRKKDNPGWRVYPDGKIDKK